MNPLQDNNKRYFEVICSLDGERRMQIAFELHELSLKLAQASLQEQQPGITLEEASREINKRLSYAAGKTPVARP